MKKGENIMENQHGEAVETPSQNKASMGKIGFMGIFAVACVLFGSHAGGGFATGNPATQN